MRPPLAHLSQPRLPQPSMAFLLPGLRRGLLVSTPLLLSTPLLVRHMHRPISCDAPAALAPGAWQTSSQSRGATTPTTTLQSSILNPKTVRQISMGSVLGLLGGLGVSVFSKPLAVLLGLGMVLVHVSPFFILLLA